MSKEIQKPITVGDVAAWLDTKFHPEYQESYDNSGFLLGEHGAEYRGTLVSLDLTEAVVAEARSLGLNLIVTHHPFIFSGVKRLTDMSDTGRLVMSLIRSGIAVYAAHTNLDNLAWGVSGELAKRIGLKNCRTLKPIAADAEGADIGSGTVGDLPQAVEADRFLQELKQLLGLPCIRTSDHRSDLPIKRIALCGGAGSFLIADAIAEGADLYLTGDLKYHDFQKTDGHMVLADIGHYESEQFAKEIIFRAILEKFSNFACRISETQEGVVKYI